MPLSNGGRFDFDDGGSYCGGWEEGRASGHGICTGPENKGEYAGSWHNGYEVSGTYTWPNGATYCGQWQNGRRHGYGYESRRRHTYIGEYSMNVRGRYGRLQYVHPITRQVLATYMGTFTNNSYDGYGKETYPDGSHYVGQFQGCLRHGYGVRHSVPYGRAQGPRHIMRRRGSVASLRSIVRNIEPEHDPERPSTSDAGCCEIRGGFILRERSKPPSRRRSLSERSLAVKRSILSNLRIKKQHSTGDIHQKVVSMTGSLRSSGSLMSCTSDDSEPPAPRSNELTEFQEDPIGDDVTETYRGEWKTDQRSGFGVCERSDNLRYVGEWAGNMKNGFGVTYLRDGTKEEGRYRNNVLVSSLRRRNIFLRTPRMREKIDSSIDAALRAASIADQKSDIAVSRAHTSIDRVKSAESTVVQVLKDTQLARLAAAQFDPKFAQVGLQYQKNIRRPNERMMLNDMGNHVNHVSFDSMIESTRSIPPEFGSRATQSYQNLPIANNIGASSSGQAERAPGRVADVQHQIDSDYSKSFDYGQNAPPKSMYGNNVNSGHVHEPNPGMLHPNAVPTPLHHSGSIGAHNIDTTLTSDGHSELNESRPDPRTNDDLGSSPKQTPLRRGRQSGGSIVSLSDDHYDQYTLSRNSSDATDVSRLRRNRPSLTRQTEVNADPVLINRRSTLASARDRPGYVAPSVGPTTTNLGERDGDRGSLPNLVELEVQGVTLRREDASRLASQRRQEAQRMQEEQELMRHNPIRFFFSPTFKAWLIRWRMPIFLALFNFILLYSLVHILRLERGGRNSGTRRGPPPPPSPSSTTQDP